MTTMTSRLDARLGELERDAALRGFSALAFIATRVNGHHLTTARIVRSSLGSGFMARCDRPGCGASVWEVSDLAGGHGAGPIVLCEAERAAVR